MNDNRKSFAKAINYTLGAGMVAGLAMTNAPVAAQNNSEGATDLDRVHVTGSRIKRTDVEGALPITVIDRETIELSGESNAADLVRNLPYNIAGSYRPQSGSSFGGIAEVNLRGLGAARTLVLINGRRMPKSPLTGASSDLSMIPMGAIERIEILSDGASAVYGSDAIGGVVNVVLRSDFEGAEIMVGRAEVNPRGGDRREGYVNFGTASNTSSLIGGVSVNSRDIIFARDFWWTQPGASVYGNNFTTIDASGADNFNLTALPASCDFPEQPAFFIAPNAGSLTGEFCAYDFTRVSADEASIKNNSIFLRGSHQFTDNWSVFSDVMVAKTQSFGRYAPAPDDSRFVAPITADSPNNPTNPSSPIYDPTLGLDPQSINIWHRFDALGNRDSFIDSELYDLVVGTQGYVGPLEIEAGARWTRNKVFDIGYGYLARAFAWDAIESGAYMVNDPFGAPDAILNGMRATISRISTFDQNELFGSVGFDAGNIGATPIQWFVGAEYREELYNDQYDSQSEAGLIGGSAGNSAAGDRDVTSLFGEVLLPLLDNLEVSVAARFDDYSDYGSDFSPSISFRYEPMDGYVLRGSWGEGFRAPDFPALTQQEAFSADSVNDPQSCINAGQPETCTLQINAFRIANPDLDSEKSEQFSLGVTFAPLGWFSGTLDYANITIRDRIAFFSAQNLINRDIYLPIPPGLGVTRAPNGSIVRINTGYGNEGTVDTSFFDLNLRAAFDLMGGRLFHNLNVVRLQTQSVDGGRQTVRDPGVPRHRAILENRYAFGDFSFAYNLNYISGQCDRIVYSECEGRAPSYTTHDVQGNYFTPWNGRITVGARNLWNRQPAIGRGNFGSRDYDFSLYDAYGRTTYLRYTQSF